MKKTSPKTLKRQNTKILPATNLTRPFVQISIFAIFTLMLIANIARAQQDVDVSQILGEQISVNPDKIPMSQEDIEKLKNEYLKQQWNEVLSKNRIIGPARNFFLNGKTQIVFQALFAYKYGFSLTFFMIFLLWIFVFVCSSKSFSPKGKISWLIGFGIAVILAQMNALNYTATSFIDLMIKGENWWARAIIIIIALGFLALGFYLSKILSQYWKKNEEKKDKSKQKQQIKEVNALIEPIKQN